MVRIGRAPSDRAVRLCRGDIDGASVVAEGWDEPTDPERT
jgi:hypothetical protein